MRTPCEISTPCRKHKDKSDVRSWGASTSIGSRWVFGRGNVFASFIGASCTDIDTRITDTATLKDKLPNADPAAQFQMFGAG